MGERIDIVDFEKEAKRLKRKELFEDRLYDLSEWVDKYGGVFILGTYAINGAIIALEIMHRRRRKND